MRAVILAAGEGIRLMPLTKIVPKPLVPIELDKSGRFKSVIERLIGQIVNAGIMNITIVVNYKEDIVREYIGNGNKFGCSIDYVKQEQLDGNAGAFYCTQNLVENDDVLICDCDNFFYDFDAIKKMKEMHYREKLDLTVGVSKVEDVTKYAVIKTDKYGAPIGIFEKPKDKKEWGSLAKSGAMILSNSLAKLDKNIAESGDGLYTTTQIVAYCIQNNLKIKLFNLEFSDIGTWEEYISQFKKNLVK